MTPSSRGALIVVGLLAIAAQGAEPKDFVAPQAMTDAEIQRMKENSKSGLLRYGKSVSDQPEPFPWMAFMLGVITVAGVAPFAWRAYRGMAQELRASDPGTVNGPERSPED